MTVGFLGCIATSAGAQIKPGRVGGEPMQDEFLSQIDSASSSTFGERIDPYSGELIINMEDIRLPGRGGLDLVIQRYYKSSIWNRTDASDFIYHAAAMDVGDGLGGNGWQLHMGKVRNPGGIGSPGSIDPQNPAQPGTCTATADNPVVIMPDGSEHVLYRHATEWDQLDRVMITRDRWRFRWDSATRTWFLTLTDGTVYEFKEPGPCLQGGCYAGPCLRCDSGCTCEPETNGYLDMVGNPYVMATAIEDVNGNRIEIEYDSQWGQIERITDTYGRVVEFNYIAGKVAAGDLCLPDAVQRPKIDTIVVKQTASHRPSQTWNYNYAPASFEAGAVACSQSLCNYSFATAGQCPTIVVQRTVDFLKEVVPPEGDRWKFEYKPGTSTYSAGRGMLSKVTFPSGGTIFYTYSGTDFDVGHENGTVERSTVASKTVAGRGVTPGTWSYSYPLVAGREGHQTEVTGPDGFNETFTYHGWTDFVSDDPDLWRVGLLKSQSTRLDNLQTVTVENTWEQGEKVAEDCQFTTPWNGFLGGNQGRLRQGIHFIKPQQVVTTVQRGMSEWTTTASNFDLFGNPEEISEMGELERTTTLSYWTDPALNILDGRVASRHVVPGGLESFEYDSLGRLESRVINGVETRFSYDDDGRLTAEVEENGTSDRETRYKNYSWGHPETIEVELGVHDIVIQRDFSPMGFLLFEEDGRGSQTRTEYGHDELGRLTHSEPPLGARTCIDYRPDLSFVAVQRWSCSNGNGYDIKYSFDGFGRLTEGLDEETGDKRQITYNALGTKTEESLYPGGVSQAVNTFRYDLLGRLTEVTHADGDSVSYTYDGSSITVTDEKNRQTVFTYEAFGAPDARRLKEVKDALMNTWRYTYDLTKNELTDVDAPGTMGDRSFTYTDQHFLRTETHPESGTTTYEHTPLGWVRSRERGGERVEFFYDRSGRLVSSQDPATNEQVTFEYDGAGLRTEMIGPHGTFKYEYDRNQNLTTKTSEIGGNTFHLIYRYDSRDRLERIEYPHGRKVTYKYDNANRVKSATDPTGDFVTDVTYHTSGGIDVLKLEGNVTTDYGYDLRNRLSALHTSSTLGGDLVNLTLGYDPVGNLTTWTDQRDASASRTFDYDDLNRLTSASAPGMWGTRSYTYDELGNRTQLNDGTTTTTYAYDPTTGRLTQVSGEGGGTYGYDLAGRLISAPFVPGPDPEPPPPPQPQPRLVAEKTDSLDVDGDGNGAPSPGDHLGYTVTISNSGNAAATGVVFTDTPDRNTSVVDGSVTTTQGNVTASHPITVDLGTLAEGTTATITFQVAVVDPVPIDVNHVANQGLVETNELPPVPTDDPDTPTTNDATTTSLSVPPPPPSPQVSLGPRLLFEHREAGGRAVFGYAAAPEGIQSIRLSFVPADQLGIETVVYGWPRPDVCDWTARVYGFRDPNCPNVGFWALLKDKRLIQSFPEEDFYQLSVATTTNSGGVFRDDHTFSLFLEPELTRPQVSIEYPRLGAAEVENERTKLRGWALDASGIVDISFSLDGQPLAEDSYAYGIPRPDVCQSNAGLGDPNCRLENVGWEVLFDGGASAVGNTHTLVVTVEDSAGRSATSGRTFTIVDHNPETPTTPFLGEPFQIPAKDTKTWIGVSDYDVGPAGAAYFDNSLGNSSTTQCFYRDAGDVDLRTDVVAGLPCFVTLENIEAGEWLGYSVEIEEPGYYTVWLETSAGVPGKLHFEIDGVPVTEPASPPLCGEGQPPPCASLTLVVEDVYLEPPPGGGVRQLRLVFDEAWTDSTAFRFIVLRQEDPLPVPFTGLPAAVPGTIVEAEHYDTSPIFIGQSVGYRDATLGNQAAAPFRPNEWVDAGTEGSRIVVTDLQLGEWLDYTLNVTQAGTYDLEMRFANGQQAEGALDVLVDGVVKSSVAIPSTSGGWVTGVISDLFLPQGRHVLRLAPGEVSYKLDSMQFKEPSLCPATANDDAYTVAADGQWIDVFFSKILSNDLPEALSNPQIIRFPTGTLEVNPINGLVYSPPADWQANDSFEYLVYSDGNPECFDTATVSFNISPPPAPSAGFSRSCTGLVCDFDGSSSTGSRLRFEWTLGDGTATIGQSVSHAYGAFATYTVSLTVTDELNRQSTVSKTVTPVVGVDDTLSADCCSTASGDVGQFLSNDLGPSRIFGGLTQTTGNGVLTLVGSTFEYTPSVSEGTDSFEYRVESSTIGYSADTATVTITIVPPAPSANFSRSCTGLVCAFDAGSSTGSGLRFEWVLGDGTATVGQSLSHAYNAFATYTVSLTVTDELGRQSTLSKTVTPVVGVDDTLTAVSCSTASGDVGQFLSNDLGPNRVFGGVTRTTNNGVLTLAGSTFEYTPSVSEGTDSFDYQVTSSTVGHNADNATVAITVLPDEPPLPGFEVSCDYLACEFTDKTTDDHGYQIVAWDFGDGTTSTAETPSHTYAASGSYQIQLTVVDLCDRVETVTREIEVVSLEEVLLILL